MPTFILKQINKLNSVPQYFQWFMEKRKVFKKHKCVLLFKNLLKHIVNVFYY